MDNEQWEDITEDIINLDDILNIQYFNDGRYTMTKEVARVFVGTHNDGTYEEVDVIRIWRRKS